MICKTCNMMNEAGAQVCASCGANLEKKQNSNKILFAILGVVAVAILALVLVLALGGGHGFDTPEEAAIAFVEGSRGGNADLAKEAMYPDVINDKVEEQLEKMQKIIEEEGDENYDFKAKLSTNMPNLCDKLEDFYEENDVEITVDDVQVVEVNYKTKGESSTTTLTIFVAKIDGTWYAAFAN